MTINGKERFPMTSKESFQIRCRYLLESGRFPFADRLGQKYLNDDECDWRSEVIRQWLIEHPHDPVVVGKQPS